MNQDRIFRLKQEFQNFQKVCIVSSVNNLLEKKVSQKNSFNILDSCEKTQSTFTRNGIKYLHRM